MSIILLDFNSISTDVRWSFNSLSIGVAWMFRFQCFYWVLMRLQLISLGFFIRFELIINGIGFSLALVDIDVNLISLALIGF